MLDQLVAKYPQSQWYTEAQFRRGEILFSAGRYHDAELAYNAVIKAGPEGDFYEQGLYKHGWSLFKQSRGEESVASFLKVLDRVLIRDGKLRDALRCATRRSSSEGPRAAATSDLDGPGRWTLLATTRQRSVYAHMLYEGLGNLYITKERFQDAAPAFEAWAKRRPDDRYAPSLQMRTIEAYQKGGFASLVLEGKQAFVERYAFGSAFWQIAHDCRRAEVAAQLKTTQKDLAEYFHAKAQKSKKVEDYTASGTLVSRDARLLPAGPGSAGDALPARRGAVRIATLRRKPREYERTAYDYPLRQVSAPVTRR